MKRWTLEGIQEELLSTLKETYPDLNLTKLLQDDVILMNDHSGKYSGIYIFHFFYETQPDQYLHYPTLASTTMRTLVSLCDNYGVTLSLVDAAAFIWKKKKWPIRFRFDPERHVTYAQASYYYMYGFRPEDTENDQQVTEAIRTNPELISLLTTFQGLTAQIRMRFDIRGLVPEDLQHRLSLVESLSFHHIFATSDKIVTFASDGVMRLVDVDLHEIGSVPLVPSTSTFVSPALCQDGTGRFFYIRPETERMWAVDVWTLESNNFIKSSTHRFSDNFGYDPSFTFVEGLRDVSFQSESKSFKENWGTPKFAKHIHHEGQNHVIFNIDEVFLVFTLETKKFTVLGTFHTFDASLITTPEGQLHIRCPGQEETAALREWRLKPDTAEITVDKVTPINGYTEATCLYLGLHDQVFIGVFRDGKGAIGKLLYDDTAMSRDPSLEVKYECDYGRLKRMIPADGERYDPLTMGICLWEDGHMTLHTPEAGRTMKSDRVAFDAIVVDKDAFVTYDDGTISKYASLF